MLNHRKINSGHHFQFQNNYYLPVTSSGKEKYFNKGTKVLVIKSFDGRLFTSIGDELFATKRLEEHEKQSKEFDMIQKKSQKKTSKLSYIPPMSHPWKHDSFVRYLKTKGITQEEFDQKQTHRNIV